MNFEIPNNSLFLTTEMKSNCLKFTEWQTIIQMWQTWIFRQPDFKSRMNIVQKITNLNVIEKDITFWYTL